VNNNGYFVFCSWKIGWRWGVEGISPPPPPFLQQASVQKFKDDMNGLSSTPDICSMLLDNIFKKCTEVGLASPRSLYVPGSPPRCLPSACLAGQTSTGTTSSVSSADGEKPNVSFYLCKYFLDRFFCHIVSYGISIEF
jgi:hypothetical protein